LDTHHLQTFVDVVTLGSFAAAARTRDLAPSQVTRSVALVEKTLGARLLHRTTRKLTLTAAGQAYFDRVRPLLTELEAAGEEVRSSTASIRGTVRISASVAYGQAVLVPLLPELHARYPAMDIELLLTDAVVDLAKDRIDLALRLAPAVDTALVGLPLASARYRVCASPEYVRRCGSPGVPGDLSACACPRFALPGFRSQWLFRSGDGLVETVNVCGWLIVSTALALHRAALGGLGPTLLPDWLVEPDLAAGRLVDLFPRHEATATQFDSKIWLLYVSRQHLPRRVRAVADFLKAQLVR
jgi:DNA-binding transcriptional LysR family regulator